MADDVDIDELVNEHKEETGDGRHATEAAVEQNDDTPALEDAIADAYQAINEGDVSSNLTLRDENLAALFYGLEEADDLDKVGTEAAAILDRDDNTDGNRAAVLRNLVRIGLVEVDESLMESGKEGRRKFLESQTDDF